MNGGGRFVQFVRYGIPGLLLVVGVAVAFLPGGPTLSTALIGVALCVLLLNVLYRIGVTGDRDRDREEEAREYFDAHGRWPGE